MSRFNRYVLWILIKYTFLVQVVVAAVAFFAGGISGIRRYNEYNATMKDILMVELISLPVKINSTAVIAIVTASIVTVVVLMRSKEMLAYASLGGRVGKALVPFVFLAMIVTGSFLTFEYYFYPHLKIAQYRYAAEQIRGEQYWGNQDRLVNMWMIDNNRRLIHAEVIDPIGKMVSNVIEYNITDDFQLESIRMFDMAKFDGEKWVLTNVRETNMMSLPPKVNIQAELVMESQILDDLATMSGKRRKELEPKQLAQMIRVLKGHGLNAVEYEMLYYEKYAEAFSAIILVILVVPMGIDFSRRYSPLLSAIGSFALALAFWGTLAAFNSFGYSGILAPFWANMLPLVIFLVLGVAVLIWREKAK